MDTTEKMRRPTINDWPGRVPVTPGSPADPIAARLEVIVSRSRRRRVLSRIWGAFTQGLERLVPPAAPTEDTETPLRIRFPFF
ncbi:MAG: hypothetical protein JO007_10960 [Alphaproteobacteria bacterium]|nr:hypothetical protein [Alphaproteobacteria bacterium]